MNFDRRTRRRARAALAIAAALVTAACTGGGAAPQISKPGDPPLLVNPISLAFTAVGQSQTILAQETLYSNPFTAVTSNNAVATVSPGSTYGGFTVTAVAAGTATITVSDTNNQHVTVSVGVTTTSGGIK